MVSKRALPLCRTNFIFLFVSLRRGILRLWFASLAPPSLCTFIYFFFLPIHFRCSLLSFTSPVLFFSYIHWCAHTHMCVYIYVRINTHARPTHRIQPHKFHPGRYSVERNKISRLYRKFLGHIFANAATCLFGPFLIFFFSFTFSTASYFIIENWSLILF